MRLYIIVIFFGLQLLFCCDGFAQTKVWNVIFEENQSRIGLEQTEVLSELIRYLSKQDNQNLKIELEGRFDNPTTFTAASRLFNQRTKLISDYLINNQIVSKVHFDEPLFQFSKSTAFLTNIDSSVQARQVVRIFLNYDNQIIDNNDVASDISSNPTNSNVTTKTSSVKPISKNIEKRPENITIKCSPLTNSFSFKYYCGQSVTILSKNGIEIRLAKNAIQNCEDGMQLFVKLKLASTTEELIALGNLSPNKKKYFRLGNYLDFRISSNNNKTVQLKGCLSLKIPSREIEQASLGIMRNRSWRTVRKPNSFKYINGNYEIKYCFSFQNHVAFAIGQPSYKKIYVRIDNKDIASDKATKSNPSQPIMVYKDGSIAFLNTSWKKDSDVKSKFWKYYEFPIYKNLKIEGVIEDSYLMTTKTTTIVSLGSWDLSERQLALYELKADISLATTTKGKVKGIRKERIMKRKQLVYRVNNANYQMMKYKPAVLTGFYDDNSKKKRRRTLKYSDKYYVSLRK